MILLLVVLSVAAYYKFILGSCYLVHIQRFFCGLRPTRLLYLWNHLQLNDEISLFVGRHVYQWKHINEKHKLSLQ